MVRTTNLVRILAMAGMMMGTSGFFGNNSNNGYGLDTSTFGGHLANDPGGAGSYDRSMPKGPSGSL